MVGVLTTGICMPYPFPRLDTEEKVIADQVHPNLTGSARPRGTCKEKPKFKKQIGASGLDRLLNFYRKVTGKQARSS